MLKLLFRGLLKASSSYYGDAIGLAPIKMTGTQKVKGHKNDNFWIKDCEEHPTRIACLNYES